MLPDRLGMAGYGVAKTKHGLGLLGNEPFVTRKSRSKGSRSPDHHHHPWDYPVDHVGDEMRANGR